jgi:predicted ATPase
MVSAMFSNLRLIQFKNFDNASLTLGPLSIVIGTNASGKSNLRDAFRFLHGIGRGYTLADILGERYGQGGELQWRGLRGGNREAAQIGKDRFALEAHFSLINEDSQEAAAYYHVSVQTIGTKQAPQIFFEELQADKEGAIVFSPPADSSLPVRVLGSREYPSLVLLRQQPMLSQYPEHSQAPFRKRAIARLTLDTFASMRFLDLNPDAMRLPSFPGQTVLGDRGENLSSVLQAICAEAEQKRTLVQWLRELTPMDAVDFEFPTDQIGRVLVTLVEEDGRRTTAYSASDGTLRFLGMLAALLGPNPAKFYFLEELENGIHPTRLHLLIQLIEQRVARGDVQVVATTHSPQLLGLVSKETLEHVSLVYRREGEASAQIRRLVDLPHAREILGEVSPARLHASGWFEDAVAFAEPVGVE